MTRIAFGSPEALAVLEADKTMERKRRESPEKIERLRAELEEVENELAECERRIDHLNGERNSINLSIKKLERFIASGVTA